MMDMLLLIFCAKPKFEEHTLRLQVDSCNAGNHSIIDNRQGILNNHRQNEGKYPEDCIQVWPSQLTVANNTKNPRLFRQLF